MNQTSMPLIDALNHHINKQSISFHVPGHKNGLLFTDDYFAQFTRYDVTELTGLDDLHEPEEAIAEAEALLSNVYQTEKSYFLVNGSTVGNLAMILASCREGDDVLVQRNCHKSILSAFMLAKVNPIFITPIDATKGIELEDVKTAFEAYPNIRACIFTYPDYYGRTYDLRTIIQWIHKHEAVVLIDEAHGPHFQLGHGGIPKSALACGADIVVHSAHKMLPAMTMGSYLHINSERINQRKVKQYLTMLQSSSPSYPIMASLDYARHYLAHFTKADLAYTLQCRADFIQQIEEATELSIMPSVKDQDPLKLIVYHPDVSGFVLQEKLEELAIYPELADPEGVLFTFPLLKVGMDFPFEKAIKQMSQLTIQKMEQIAIEMEHIPLEKLTGLALSYDEMADLPTEIIKIEESEGRIAAQMLIPYPPGIPLFLIGERITPHHITTLQYLLKHQARFQGGDMLWEGRVIVYKL